MLGDIRNVLSNYRPHYPVLSDGRKEKVANVISPESLYYLKAPFDKLIDNAEHISGLASFTRTDISVNTRDVVYRQRLLFQFVNRFLCLHPFLADQIANAIVRLEMLPIHGYINSAAPGKKR